LASIIVLTVIGLFIVGIHRLRFDADILSSLPQDDSVLADGHYILTHYPIYDRVVVDVGYPGGRIDVLEEGATYVEKKMRMSGLFREVGFQQIGQLIPELMRYITEHLPILFSEAELQNNITPLLTPERVYQTLNDQLSSLQGLGGIGQARFISYDPLLLRNRILSHLSTLIPTKDVRIVNGKLVSRDGNHILIVAEPLISGIDTQNAAKIAALMKDISHELQMKYGRHGGFTLTPIGAYRAALDNEVNTKWNIKKAVLFSMGAIILLLLAAFPRPMIGLLALVPAFAGTMMAVFVYSLIHSSISLLAIGFGSAIISFTVDYGITYLLFLDRPHETRGFEVTKEVWSLGLLAMLTTAVSFAFLTLSGFPTLLQIGQFAAMGVLFTYLFVHLVFPLIFPVLPAARNLSYLPFQRFINRIFRIQGMWTVYTAAAFGIFMLFFAKPVFNIDLTQMSSVSRETRHAENLVLNVWGDVMNKKYLMVEGRDKKDLQRKCDHLMSLLSREMTEGRISQFFISSMIFPGEELAKINETSWHEFWSPLRIAQLRQSLESSSRQLGFSSNAFDPFYTLLKKHDVKCGDMADRYSVLFGVKQNQDTQTWVQVVTLTPSTSYRAEDFYQRFAATGLSRVFDPALFTKRIEMLLLSSFIKMAFIIAAITILTAFIYFLDWQLTLLGMAPTIFAMICTLGTLRLIGEPLGIPTLMVSVVVIGMGTDYALYLVRSYQRYLDDSNPGVELIFLSVFLSFATTFLGFGILATSDNTMLKSAGLGLALGIGYSFLGAVTITPPFLKRIFVPISLTEEVILPGSKQHLRSVDIRYRHMEPYPRLFAHFKILLDPMFPNLIRFIKNPRVIIDIGTGYGVPAVWLLELFPKARIYGIEPNPKRARFAARTIGKRGSVEVKRAPDIPDTSEKVDTVLLIDVVHYLPADELRMTLSRLHERLSPDGSLIFRLTIPSAARFPWKRWIEVLRIKLQKGQVYYRTENEILKIISESGFTVTVSEASASNDEERWIIAVLSSPRIDEAFPIA